MKLIGYHRFKGEKDGRSWDFYQLIIDKEEKSTDTDSCGVQLLMLRRNGSYNLPSVNTSVFNDAVKAGVHIGSSVNLYFDYEGHVKLEPAQSLFDDIR